MGSPPFTLEFLIYVFYFCSKSIILRKANSGYNYAFTTNTILSPVFYKSACGFRLHACSINLRHWFLTFFYQWTIPHLQLMFIKNCRKKPHAFLSPDFPISNEFFVLVRSRICRPAPPKIKKNKTITKYL